MGEVITFEPLKPAKNFRCRVTEGDAVNREFKGAGPFECEAYEWRSIERTGLFRRIEQKEDAQAGKPVPQTAKAIMP